MSIHDEGDNAGAGRTSPPKIDLREIDAGLVFYSYSAPRRTDATVISKLAASIRENGLLHPITVVPSIHCHGTTPYDAFDVVAGNHRYEAMRELRWTAMPCIVVTLDKLHAELVAIDENLMRASLTPAQSAWQIDRRKAIYETLHPETARGASQAAGMNKAVGKNVSEKSSLTFAKSTAKAMGKTTRHVEIEAARGKALGDDLKVIEGTTLDKGVELDALAKLPPAERADLVKRASEGEIVTARPKLAEVVEIITPSKPAWQLSAEKMLKDCPDDARKLACFILDRTGGRNESKPTARGRTVVSVGKEILRSYSEADVMFLAAFLIEQSGDNAKVDRRSPALTPIVRPATLELTDSDYEALEDGLTAA